MPASRRPCSTCWWRECCSSRAAPNSSCRDCTCSDREERSIWGRRGEGGEERGREGGKGGKEGREGRKGREGRRGGREEWGRREGGRGREGGGREKREGEKLHVFPHISISHLSNSIGSQKNTHELSKHTTTCTYMQQHVPQEFC